MKSRPALRSSQLRGQAAAYEIMTTHSDSGSGAPRELHSQQGVLPAHLPSALPLQPMSVPVFVGHSLLPPSLRARTRPVTQGHPLPCLSCCLTPATLNHELFPQSTVPVPLLFALPRLPFLMFVFKYFLPAFQNSAQMSPL